jgi:tripartite-type tricarboxylate transporter receptor subunit TctC
MKLTHASVVLLAATVGLGAPARSQEQYPSKPITLVTTQAPGTTLDILARLYADRLPKHLGQPVIVSNRPGAGGLIAAQAVAVAPADGLTLLMANSGHAILGTLNKNLPFDPVRDFAGISMIGETPALVVVPPSLGARTVQEFVALAKAKPGTINYASAGIGSATHLAGAYFARQAGIDMVHIPYKLGSDILADLIAGRVEVTFAPPAFVLPLLNEGKLLALGASTAGAMREPIEVPSIRSAGINFEYSTWYGFLAPAKTPAAVLQKLSRAIAEVSEDPELKAKVRVQGITPRSVALRDFDGYIGTEMDRLGPVLKDIGDKVNN